MSSNDCGQHGSDDDGVCGEGGKKRLCRLFAGLSIFLVVCLIIILIVWAVLQPKKPNFILKDITVYAFNVSSASPSFLTINLQVSLSARNPNGRIGVYYDRLDVYASYRNQQITLRYQIPPTYQGHQEVDDWSPFVYGTNVPIAPYNGMLLSQERDMGDVRVKIKIDGRVRWKVGAFITGRYHLYVECPADIMFGDRNSGGVAGGAVKYQYLRKCSVDV